MDAPPPPTSASGLKNNVAFWRAQSEQLERDRRNLRYLLVVGPTTAVVVFVLSRHGLASLGVLGLCLTAWALGLYMTTVRREEYAFAQAAAEAELAAAVGEASAHQGAAPQTAANLRPKP